MAILQVDAPDGIIIDLCEEPEQLLQATRSELVGADLVEILAVASFTEATAVAEAMERGLLCWTTGEPPNERSFRAKSRRFESWQEPRHEDGVSLDRFFVDALVAGIPFPTYVESCYWQVIEAPSKSIGRQPMP